MAIFDYELNAALDDLFEELWKELTQEENEVTRS